MSFGPRVWYVKIDATGRTTAHRGRTPSQSCKTALTLRLLGSSLGGGGALFRAVRRQYPHTYYEGRSRRLMGDSWGRDQSFPARDPFAHPTRLYCSNCTNYTVVGASNTRLDGFTLSASGRGHDMNPFFFERECLTLQDGRHCYKLQSVKQHWCWH